MSDDKRDPSSLRSSGLASFIGYSVVKERVRRAGQKQAFLRMLNRFMLRMLTQKYRYVKRYFYVLDEQGDVRGAADPSAQHYAEICKMRFRGAASAVDFFAVAHAENEDQQPVVFDFADEAVIADAILPKLSQFGAAQGLSDAARIFERSQPLVKELQDTLASGRIELAEFVVDLSGELNPPRHAASMRPQVE